MTTMVGPSGSAVERIRTYRTIFKALEGLEAKVNEKKVQSRRWKSSALAMGAIAFVAASGMVVAITATGNTFYGLAGETNTYDTSVFVLTLGTQSLLGGASAAVGTTNSYAASVEVLIANAGVANTALVVGHWSYSATIAEVGINTFAQSATAYYKVELFIDGVSQGALYLKNAVGDTLNVEGVACKWDIGTNLPTTGAYVIKVSQMAA
jgi:hypothetical protein